LGAWDVFLEDMAELGLKPNMALFCREHSLNKSTFHGWLNKRVITNAKRDVEKWVELKLRSGNVVTTKDIFDYIREYKSELFNGKKYTNKRMFSYRILCKMKIKINGYEEIQENLLKIEKRKIKKIEKVPVVCAEVERFSSNIAGEGIRAKSDIKRGACIIEFIGEVISREEFELRNKKKRDIYMMKAGENCYIDPEKKGNMARFINHCCDSNAVAKFHRINGFPRIFIYAIKDISRGVEITINYGCSYRFVKCMCICCILN